VDESALLEYVAFASYQFFERLSLFTAYTTSEVFSAEPVVSRAPASRRPWREIATASQFSHFPKEGAKHETSEEPITERSSDFGFGASRVLSTILRAAPRANLGGNTRENIH
jgi:hypothetical protein